MSIGNVYFSIARKRRLIALEALTHRQPELPGFGEQAVVAPIPDQNVTSLHEWAK